MTDCIFCRIVAGQLPATRVYEDDRVFAFEDVQPAAPTHVLIVPRRHIATLDDTGGSDDALLGQMLAAARAIAGQRGLSSGYRVVMNVHAGAGQSVFHIHLHLLGGRALAWPPG